MQRTTDERQARAKAELDKLYPGLTNKQITDIQRQRLEWAQAHPLGTDLHPTTAARITQAESKIVDDAMRTPFYKEHVNTFGKAKTYGKIKPDPKRMGKADPSIKVNNSDEPRVTEPEEAA